MALLVAAGLLAAGAAGPSRKERLAALPDEDRVWLTEYVAPIILPEEEKLFLELTEPHERERFKREFWERRERDSQPPPLGPGYGARYAELRRLADEVYDGWRNDAGRMVLRYGEPPDVHEVHCENVFRGLEIWTYTNTSIRPGRAQFFFYRFQPLAPRKLWDVGVSNKDIFQPNSCKQTFESLGLDCPGRASLTDRCSRPCPEDCDIYELYMQIRERQHNAFGAFMERTKLLAPPLLPLEGIDRIKDVSATAADPNAKKINVEGPSSRPGTPPEPTPTPESRHQLSVDEIRERIVHLEPKYRQWLELAAPLLTLDELSLFLQLSPSEKDKFIRTFWKRQS
jgi:GWxTD domain-containing protein